MTARTARLEDIPGVVDVALQFNVYQPTEERVTELFLQAESCGGMFVAEHEGAIIGFLCAIRMPHPFTGRDYVNVVAWWVPAERRGLGAGIALLREMLRWISTQTLDMVTISAPLSSRLDKVLRAFDFRPVEVVHMRGGKWL